MIYFFVVWFLAAFVFGSKLGRFLDKNPIVK